MAILKDAAGGTGKLGIGAATTALRAQQRPIDVGALGAYAISAASGTIAAGLAGASTIFSMRWGDATRTCVIECVTFAAWNSGTAFSAGTFTFDMIVARAFTVSDSAQTALSLAGNTAKKRTSFGTSLIAASGDLRIANTAGITAGTRTLDNFTLNQFRGFVPATQVNYPMVGDAAVTVPGASTVAGPIIPTALWPISAALGNVRWPLVLVQNEGFVLRATVPATGTWTFVVGMEWSEVLSTDGFN